MNMFKATLQQSDQTTSPFCSSARKLFFDDNTQPAQQSLIPKRLAFLEEDKLMEDSGALPFAMAEKTPQHPHDLENVSPNVMKPSLIQSSRRLLFQGPEFEQNASNQLQSEVPQSPLFSRVQQYNEIDSQAQRNMNTIEQPQAQTNINQLYNGAQSFKVQYPLTPNGFQSTFGDQPMLANEFKLKNFTYSPMPGIKTQSMIYPTIPEYGFTSKIMSAQKKKKFVPATPAKKNLKMSSRPLSGKANRFGIIHNPSQPDSEDIFSPIANLLKLSETLDSNGNQKMIINTIPLKHNRFLVDFEQIGKLGEGSFGEAFKVRSRLDGQIYAVKKAKERYLGYKDREQKLQEVLKAMKLCKEDFGKSQLEHQSPEDDEDIQFYRSYCVKVIEAWEESGHLYIQSEICEKGNLNDYLLEMSRSRQIPVDDSTLWSQVVTEEVIWKFLFEMACALKHMHDSGFVHLDVKPSNFFVKENGQLALGDFGQAIELSKVPKLRDDDVEGDSVFMAPELLQNNLSPEEKISPKADIFSLGVSLLEIASGMNLPQNGLMWQKLRQAGEGVIRFSPSANRSLQLEQLINLMMEPNPSSRPSADEILMHPRLQSIMNSFKESSIPSSTTVQKARLPTFVRHLNLKKLQYSPIVEKFKNPLSSNRSDNNGPHYLSKKQEMILISPRILLSAQKQQQYQSKMLSKKSDLSRGRQERGDSDEYDQDPCRVKRRRKSSIGSISSNGGGQRMRKERSRSNEGRIADDDIDERTNSMNLRTFGRSASFNEDQIEDTQSNNGGGRHLINPGNKSWHNQVAYESQTPGTLFKSAKKLEFSTADMDSSCQPKFSYQTAGDEDFKINDFSPNDEGPVAPLHIFEHKSIKRQLLNSGAKPNLTQTIFEAVDECMAEDEQSCSNRTSEVPSNFASAQNINKNQYFGGFSLIAPSQKLRSQQSKASQMDSANFGSGETFFKPFTTTQMVQDTINKLQLSSNLAPPNLGVTRQFSFNENAINTSFGGGQGQIPRAFGSNHFGETTSGGSASEMSTPRLFRIQSNASGAPSVINLPTSNTTSLGGFQLRASNTANSLFDQRQSNITFCGGVGEQRPSNYSFFDQRASNASQTNEFTQRFSTNSNNPESISPTVQNSRVSNKSRPFQLKTSPKVVNWTGGQQQQTQPYMQQCVQLTSDPYFYNNGSFQIDQVQVETNANMFSQQDTQTSLNQPPEGELADQSMAQPNEPSNDISSIKRNLFQI